MTITHPITGAVKVSRSLQIRVLIQIIFGRSHSPSVFFTYHRLLWRERVNAATCYMYGKRVLLRTRSHRKTNSRLLLLLLYHHDTLCKCRLASTGGLVTAKDSCGLRHQHHVCRASAVESTRTATQQQTLACYMVALLPLLLSARVHVPCTSSAALESA